MAIYSNMLGVSVRTNRPFLNQLGNSIGNPRLPLVLFLKWDMLRSFSPFQPALRREAILARAVKIRRAAGVYRK
jgi:hypothetical protein